MKNLFYALPLLLCLVGNSYAQTGIKFFNTAKVLELPNVSLVTGTTIDINKYLDNGYTLSAEFNDPMFMPVDIEFLALTNEKVIILRAGGSDSDCPCNILIRKRPTL